MPAKRPFNRDLALLYLRQHGYRGNPQSNTYLQRIYNSYRKQEALGLEPSLEVARRGFTQFSFQPQSESESARWHMRGLEGIRAFMKAKPKKEDFTFIVTGITNVDSPKRKQQRPSDKPKTLAISVDRSYALEAAEASSDLTEFINMLYEGDIIEWEEVHSVEILERS